jgi:hypothetical protein
MANEAKLEIGCGLGRGDDAFVTGAEAARQALGSIRRCTLSRVLVFAAIRYDREELLRGVYAVVGDVSVAGATAAGEICNGTLSLEPLQDRRYLGIRINLTTFHTHPLRHYTRLA